MSVTSKNNQALGIDPLALAKIKDLPLLAKTIAQGFLQGNHHSFQKGTGVEFSQYRSYEPGDSLSKIDWKLFARSDKYFVREAQRESNINLWLILDSSLSMLQQSESPQKSSNWHKLAYGQTLLATMAYLANQQSDNIGMMTLSSDKPLFKPALSGQQHWRRILIQLTQAQSGGIFPSTQTLQSQLRHLQNNAIVVVVSDFYEKNQEIINFLQKLNPSKTDIVAIQLETEDEIQFPYKGQIRFADRESKEQILVAAKHVKKDYLTARKDFNEQLASQLKQLQIEHWRANIDQPLNDTLHRFLSLRERKR